MRAAQSVCTHAVGGEGGYVRHMRDRVVTDVCRVDLPRAGIEQEPDIAAIADVIDQAHPRSDDVSAVAQSNDTIQIGLEAAGDLLQRALSSQQELALGTDHETIVRDV